MNKVRIIFHVPNKIDTSRSSASQLRPLKILDAFIKFGFIVDFVEGNGKERKTKINKIKENIKNGIKYGFLYSESSTSPTLITEKYGYLKYPNLDFSFFSFCKKYGIKIGLFYRDIYWALDKNKNLKSEIKKLFYKYDLFQYKRLLNVLFLPSCEMLDYIPTAFNFPVKELPSGGDIYPNKVKDGIGVSNLLYVGGIGLHYNLELLFKAVNKISNIKLTVCCRKDEWEMVKNRYLPFMSNNIIVIHNNSSDLDALYENADYFALLVEDSEYRHFAVPYKLYEATGRGIPILTTNNTKVSEIVLKNKLGFSCDYELDSMVSLLSSLNKEIPYNEVIKNVLFFAKNNTWIERVKQIADALA
jgi:hypothetical protein